MKTVIIGIAGGTASGKTTIANKLFQASINYGSVAIIRLDDYYHKYSDLSFDERKLINYDHPKAYDIDLLISDLKKLKNKESIKKPIYDFVNYKRSDDFEEIKAVNLIILEGIMTFVYPELLELLDIKIFVETPDDIRFIRRLKRDIKERGRSLDSVIDQYCATVRPMHLMFVEPSKTNADIIIPEGGRNEVAMDFLITKIIDILNK